MKAIVILPEWLKNPAVLEEKASLGCKRVAESIQKDVVEHAFTTLEDAVAAHANKTYYSGGLPFWEGALLTRVMSSDSIVPGENFSWSFVVTGPNIEDISKGNMRQDLVPAKWIKDKQGRRIPAAEAPMWVFTIKHPFLEQPIQRNLEQIPQIVGQAISESLK